MSPPLGFNNRLRARRDVPDAIHRVYPTLVNYLTEIRMEKTRPLIPRESESFEIVRYGVSSPFPCDRRRIVLIVPR
jgi:hypothetical protein